MKSLKVPTALDFVSLQVRDMEKSKKFYHNTFGFKLAEYQNPNAVVFEDGQGAIFAIRQPLVDLPESDSLGTGASLWFGWPEKIEQLYEYLRKESVTVLVPPFDTPFGRSITVANPDGYRLTFHQVEV